MFITNLSALMLFLVFVATAITILGLLFSILVSHRSGLRMGGVIVVPLLAVYTLYSFIALPLFLISAILAYIGVGIIQRWTLIHGRQRLLACLALGASLPLTISLFFNVGTATASTTTTAFFGTIIPGMAAYNFHSLDSEDRLRDLAISLAALVGLLIVGGAMVNPVTATRFDPTLTSMLYSPASDIAHLRDAVRANTMLTTSIPRWKSLILVFAGVVLSEAANARWGIRTGGLIAIPLLVVFSLSNAWVIPVYVLGTVIAYVSLRIVNSLTLFYGRVLLTITLVLAILYGFVVAMFTTTIIGFLLYFTSLLAGVGAYNLHLVAPTERRHAISVSVILFGLLLLGSRLFIQPTDTGINPSVSLINVLVLLAGLTLAGSQVYELERRRHEVVRHHARGIR